MPREYFWLKSLTADPLESIREPILPYRDLPTYVHNLVREHPGHPNWPPEEVARFFALLEPKIVNQPDEEIIDWSTFDLADHLDWELADS